MFENISRTAGATSGCNQGAAVEADAIGEQQLKQTIGEQQLKQTQSGSSSWSRHSWGAAAEVDAFRQQQLKWIDVIGEQQLKRTQAAISSWSGHNWGAAALQRKLSELTRVGKWGGSSWASKATCNSNMYVALLCFEKDLIEWIELSVYCSGSPCCNLRRLISLSIHWHCPCTKKENVSWIKAAKAWYLLQLGSCQQYCTGLHVLCFK